MSAATLDGAEHLMEGFPQHRTVLAATVAIEMLRVGRNEAPWVLDEYEGEGLLEPDDLYGLVVDAWSGAECPEHLLGRRRWIELFQRARYPRADTARVLYRGAPAAHRLGMAWTTSPDTARWFAARWATARRAPTAYLYRALAPPDAVLCDVDVVEGDGSRGEGEVVVIPSRLREIERIGRPAPVRRDALGGGPS